MTGSVDLNPNHLGKVKAILAEHVPECEVRAFGSRATWTAKDYSDLDLAVVGEGPLDWRTLDRLKEAFEESDLPMRVDVLDWHGISDSFREVIEPEHVVLVTKAYSEGTCGSNEWKDLRLGEVLTLQRGFDLPKSKRMPGPYPVIASTGPVGTHNTAAVRGPGVVIGRSGSLGGGQFIGSDFWPLNTTLWVKDFQGNDIRFCYFLLKSLNLAQFNAGSGVPTLNRNHIHPLLVKIPSVPTQRTIAHVLGTLDDKIELNRRVNETLEEMARALFKSWFVDFEPVRAKIEGRWRRGESLPGMPAEMYDLFPGRLVGLEVGEVPEGWEVGTVSQVADKIQNGGTPKRSEPRYWDMGDIPWLTSGEVRQPFVLGTQNYISRLGLEHSSAKMIPARSILVALYGATAGQVSMNIRPLATNQAVSAIIPSDGNRYFCLVSLKSQVGDLGNRAVGSAQQNISKKAVESTSVVLPPVELRLSFDTTVKGLFERIFGNLDESRVLAAQRDALLPRLVSGKVSTSMDTVEPDIAYAKEQVS